MTRRLLPLSLLLLIGCKGTLDAANKALTTAEAFTDKTAVAFEKWDRQTQEDIAHHAKDGEAARLALSEYRKKRSPVLDAFHKVDLFIQLGEVTLPLVESGLREKKDLAATLSQMADALNFLMKALDELGFRRMW